MWTWFQVEAEAWKEYFIFSVLNWVTQQQVRLTSKHINLRWALQKMCASLLDNNLTQISTVNLCHVILDNFDYTQKADLTTKKTFTVIFVTTHQLCRLVQFSFLWRSWCAFTFSNCYKHHKIKRSFVQEHANEATVWMWLSSLPCIVCTCKSRRGRCHKTNFLWPALKMSFP